MMSDKWGKKMMVRVSAMRHWGLVTRPATGGSLVTVLVLALTSFVGATSGGGADYGRVSGRVTDTQGNALIGATVLIAGPSLMGVARGSSVERVLTDGQGKFTVEHLLPGRYSIRVISVTRLPASRDSVRVRVGETARQNFVLSDIFAPFQFHVQSPRVSNVGEDWKWVLRTSGATRPVLRYAGARATDDSKPPLPPSQGLIGIDPGATRRQPLSADAGVGSVLAYVRPLSEGTDLLLAGSMTASGIEGSSLATVFRKNVLKDDLQELALVAHSMGLTDGLPIALAAGRDARGPMGRSAQGFVVSYSRTNRLSPSLTLTTGMEVDYLDAWRDAMLARPRANLEYRVSPSNLIALRYGTLASATDVAPPSWRQIPGASSDNQQDAGVTDSTLLERIGDLNAFPRVTLLGQRPRLEKSDHAELSFGRNLAKSSQLEVAAYRDSFRDAVVAGLGKPDEWTALAGDVLPNLTHDGVLLNAGQYSSTGVRVAFTHSLGSSVETAVMYATGDALAAESVSVADTDMSKHLNAALRPKRSQILAGKVSAKMPVSRTRVLASYGWMPHGCVTSVDPYGQATLELLPYFGLQVRQPLPTVPFLPAHIEAVADFRNLFADGYVKLARAGDEPLLLTPAYRSFRGGFSVQF
jgi:hypothetical protein